MNQAQIAQITAAIIAALGTVKAQKRGAPRRNYGVVAKRESYKPKNTTVELPAKQDRQLQRLAKIGRGFARKGIKVTFDKDTGRFDNVKPYKSWISEGRVVSKGQHGVMGMFHISQTEVLPKEAVVDIPANFPVTVLPPESREHFDTHDEIPF